jgi:hypothetical protein
MYALHAYVLHEVCHNLVMVHICMIRASCVITSSSSRPSIQDKGTPLMNTSGSKGSVPCTRKKTLHEADANEKNSRRIAQLADK